MENGGWPWSVRSYGKKCEKKRRSAWGGLSSLSSSRLLSPGRPEWWQERFRFGPETTHHMCTGLTARMSDVRLGTYHSGLSVKRSLTVLGSFLLGKAGERRLVSNEFGHASGVAIEVVPSMNGKTFKIQGSEWDDGELKVWFYLVSVKGKSFIFTFLTDRKPEILSQLVPKILKETTRPQQSSCPMV